MRRCLNGVFPSGSRLSLRRADLIQPGYTGGYARVTGKPELMLTKRKQLLSQRLCSHPSR
jgi:hypothetical protein